MSTVVEAVRASVHAPHRAARAPRRIALLGVGQVGGAVAALAREPHIAARFRVGSGLVRDTSRERPLAGDVCLTSSLCDALGDDPDVVIEALGGLEPARTLVLDALERGIPVVTANKSLLAAHGEALLDAAARSGTPLRYEAAVLAGVPFLGTFSRRPLARDLTGFSGIVNGTTNVILSRMAGDRSSFEAALADAQRLGYAEPDPASDVDGIDAREKLCVLLRHFGDWSVAPADVETTGITAIDAGDIAAASELGGVLKPVVSADWRDGRLAAFAGPAFVPRSHPLARVDGVQNAVLLRNRLAGDLFYAGPGAGPVATAATLLDDAVEATEGAQIAEAEWRRATPDAPSSGWFVRVSGHRLPGQTEIADLLSAYGLWLRRTTDGPGADRWFVTHGCATAGVVAALRALEAAAPCTTRALRILES